MFYVNPYCRIYINNLSFCRNTIIIDYFYQIISYYILSFILYSITYTLTICIYIQILRQNDPGISLSGRLRRIRKRFRRNCFSMADAEKSAISLLSPANPASSWEILHGKYRKSTEKALYSRQPLSVNREILRKHRKSLILTTAVVRKPENPAKA